MKVLVFFRRLSLVAAAVILLGQLRLEAAPEYKIGDKYQFNVQTYDPNIQKFKQSVFEGELRRVTGGGFYGKVLIFDDFVVKTANPDPWHGFWRVVNFRQPFPPQYLESAAMLDHLAPQIIHRLVHAEYQGQIHTPASYGFTFIEGVGFAQVIERVHGRPPTFFRDMSENDLIQQTRAELWRFGVSAGIEHAAQVHPKNPFGKPNLWIDRDGAVNWLDWLPAIPHSVFVLPAFRFAFHKDVIERIGNGEKTFNRIWTNKTRNYLQLHRYFGMPDNEIDEIKSILNAYDEVRRTYDAEMSEPLISKQVSFARTLGRIDDREAQRAIDYPVLHFPLFVNTFAGPLLSTVKDKLLSPVRFAGKVGRFAVNPSYRTEKIRSVVLYSYENAHDDGLVSDENWQHVVDSLSGRDMAKYFFIQSYLFATSAALNTATPFVLANILFSDNKLIAGAFAAFYEWVLPPLFRFVSLYGLANLLGLGHPLYMGFLGGIPKAGVVLPLPFHIANRFDEHGAEIRHYALRDVVAGVTKLRPWGGRNSELQEKIWRKFSFLRRFNKKKRGG